MSTYTLSDQPLTVARNRPGSFPMRWQSPAGQPIDITGFTLAASFGWLGVRYSLTLSVIDAPGGQFAFSWLAALVADLPRGRVAEMLVTITDAAGATYDFGYPVIGIVP